MVELEATAAYGVHDGSIVDHHVANAKLCSTDDEVSVGGRPVLSSMVNGYSHKFTHF